MFFSVWLIAILGIVVISAMIAVGIYFEENTVSLNKFEDALRVFLGIVWICFICLAFIGFIFWGHNTVEAIKAAAKAAEAIK